MKVEDIRRKGSWAQEEWILLRERESECGGGFRELGHEQTIRCWRQDGLWAMSDNSTRELFGAFAWGLAKVAQAGTPL